ncbi:MAG: hypothetical protein Q4F72_00825 [Desulfovibrionaceae bacterium]|nr:hypothetical protein [Desulfovibrionaceae bacterium]
MRPRLPLHFLLCLLLCAGLGACSPKQTANPAPATALPEPLTLEHITTLTGKDICSPKSVIFSADGSRFYINSLEGMKTVVFDAVTLQQLSVIEHSFGRDEAPLFLNGESAAFDYRNASRRDEDELNCFEGKPVEFALTHSGRYLWVSYYRRSWDRYANFSSAVAVIDTLSGKIVRVIPTGPLPKMLAPSPDGSTMAVVHWGDNSIGLLNIASSDPKDFAYTRLLVDGKRLPVSNLMGDRDAVCGYCLRGAAFSADSRYLFVGRMRNGGITVFDVTTGERLGTFTDIAPTPRHIILSRDGRKLYVTSNHAGTLTELDVAEVIGCVKSGRARASRSRSLPVGKQARTLAQSPDGKYLFAACNLSTEIVAVDIAKWEVAASAQTAPYTVGLAVSPRGDLAVTTSQGRGGQGGHAADVFRVHPPVVPDEAQLAEERKAGAEAARAESAGQTAAPVEVQAPAGEPAAPAEPPVPPARGLDSAND